MFFKLLLKFLLFYILQSYLLFLYHHIIVFFIWLLWLFVNTWYKRHIFFVNYVIFQNTCIMFDWCLLYATSLQICYIAEIPSCTLKVRKQLWLYTTASDSKWYSFLRSLKINVWWNKAMQYKNGIILGLQWSSTSYFCVCIALQIK